MEPRREEKQRQRARMACEPCRDRKRKCGGGLPCQLCINFGYESQCRYREMPRRRRATAERTSIKRQSTASEEGDSSIPMTLEHQKEVGVSEDDGHFATSLESNSGSAFVHKFAMAVDPSNAPTSQMLGWNIFLGERHTVPHEPAANVTDLLSQAGMEELALVYFSKVDPCYGFVDRSRIEHAISQRWRPDSGPGFDAILSGVAAIGSMFSSSDDLPTEASLVSLAKARLDLAAAEPPCSDSATAWVLRTVYLRMAAKLDEAWLSSCTALHVIDAAGLHCEPEAAAPFRQGILDVSPDTRRRIFGVARHLNIWLSFDLGRSRVALQNVSTIPPASRQGDYTTELLALLPLSEALDPGKTISPNQLLSTLSEVLGRSHSRPPSILAQCNLMLCLYRRLYTHKTRIPDQMLEKVVSLIRQCISAASQLVQTGSPWHHVANLPFQCTCTLLAIDTVQSFTLLVDAMACLEATTQRWRTKATQDVSAAAHVLIHIHRQRRELDAQRQSELLQLYPAEQFTGGGILDGFATGQALDEIPWFNELIPDMDFNFLESSLDA